MVLAALLLSSLAALMQAQPPPAVAVTPQLWVDARRGDDAAGDGTADRPWKTLAKAFATRGKMEEAWVEVHLHVGAATAAGGEPFPLLLPAGVRLVGWGSAVSELVGNEGQPVVVLPIEGRVALESVAVRGGSVGIATQAGGKATLEVALVDVAIEKSEIAIDLTAAEGTLVVHGDGVRTAATSIGLHADAGAPLVLDLARCVFRGGEQGMVLDDGRAKGDGPARTVHLDGCRFDGSANVGFVRRGAQGGEAAGAPWRFEGCEFRGARIGLAFELPGGDVPFVARDCRFRENANFGAAIVGSGALLPGELLFERCDFRWNGVGAQLLATGRTATLRDCRFEDSIGIGLNFGTFTGEHSRLSATRCLFARNGAAGLFAICERPEGMDVAIEQCSAVDNRGAGFERKNRKFGTGTVKVVRSIACGNAADLVRIEANEAVGCFVGGDPRFVDRARRDYRLKGDTPARDDAGPLGALPIAAGG
jgi:hypothetical protein